ncbi:MAG: type II toxin-antitoxin system Phd/YefM family antitoxin [Beijerinckiaceae bacterium]
MGHVSLSDFRANLASHLDKLEQDRDHLVVTRQGHEPVVVLPLKDWQGMEETLYLLSTKANRDMLLASIAQAEAGELIEVDPATMKPLR